MPKEFGKFLIYLHRKATTDDSIVYVYVHSGKRIGAVKFTKLIPDESSHPFLQENTCFYVDIWEFFNLKKSRPYCLYSSNFPVKQIMLDGLGKATYERALQQKIHVQPHYGYIIYRFWGDTRPDTSTELARAIWDQMIDEGKAAIIDPNLPLIVTPIPENL